MGHLISVHNNALLLIQYSSKEDTTSKYFFLHMCEFITRSLPVPLDMFDYKHDCKSLLAGWLAASINLPGSSV